MSKDRAPSSKSSWIGMAAHEIDEITTYGARVAARCACGLAQAIIDTGQDLLGTDPRALARANYSADALQARRQRESEQEAETRRILGEDDFIDMLARHRTGPSGSPGAIRAQMQQREIEAANTRDEDDYADQVHKWLQESLIAA